MPRKTEQTDEAPKPRAVRFPDRLQLADTAIVQDGRQRAGTASAPSRTPPPNARVVKSAYKTGTVSPREVRAAIKRLRAKSEIA
jgi:hypothetical protein